MKLRGEAKVGQLEPHVLVEQEVCGLDIAMDDPPLVQGGQRLEELSDDDGGLPLSVARPDGLGLSAPLPADILGGCGG